MTLPRARPIRDVLALLSLPGLGGHPTRRENAPGGVHGPTETTTIHGGVEAVRPSRVSSIGSDLTERCGDGQQYEIDHGHNPSPRENSIKKTVSRLVRAHADTAAPAQPADVAVTVLAGLPMYDPADITVAVVDVPGRAVVVTRACYKELQQRHTR